MNYRTLIAICILVVSASSVWAQSANEGGGANISGSATSGSSGTAGPPDSTEPSASPPSGNTAQPNLTPNYGLWPLVPPDTGEGGEKPQVGPSGYSGSDMFVEGGKAAFYGGGDPIRRVQTRLPPYHEVKKQDTLWNICNYYYGNPWFWPQLWAFNKNVTNPHWIYPGDRIRLIPFDAAPAKNSFTSPTDEPVEEVRLVTNAVPDLGSTIYLRQNAFADPKDLEQSGQVMGSREERLMLSHGDEIYIDGNDKFIPQVGNSYTIYRVRESLFNTDGRHVGNLVEILGTARVKRVEDKKAATAVITESINPIERNDRVGPLRRRYTRTPIKPAQQNLDGIVIGAMRTGKYIGTDELVFIDRGRKQGARNGNRFLVVRQGDGYKRLLQDADEKNPKLPKETVAEITLVDVREDVSVGLVTRAIKEIRVGERLAMLRGY